MNTLLAGSPTNTMSPGPVGAGLPKAVMFLGPVFPAGPGPVDPALPMVGVVSGTRITLTPPLPVMIPAGLTALCGLLICRFGIGELLPCGLLAFGFFPGGWPFGLASTIDALKNIEQTKRQAKICLKQHPFENFLMVFIFIPSPC